MFRSPAVPLTIDLIHPRRAKPLFHRDGWVYEEKYDGWRIVAFKDGGRVRLVSRRGRDQKDERAPYNPAHPSAAWFKVKVRHEARFVVVGIAKADADGWPYAVLVAERVDDRLVYRGRVEWGVGRRVVEAVADGARCRIRPTCTDAERRGDVICVEPSVEVEVGYSEVMGGRLRDSVLRRTVL